MIHTKFRGYQPTGSGEEGFYHIWAWRFWRRRVLPYIFEGFYHNYMGVAANLVM